MGDFFANLLSKPNFFLLLPPVFSIISIVQRWLNTEYGGNYLDSLLLQSWKWGLRRFEIEVKDLGVWDLKGDEKRIRRRVFIN